jgi:uncharacterized membrane protein YdjX (TVP38/TMEM64 family)
MNKKYKYLLILFIIIILFSFSRTKYGQKILFELINEEKKLKNEGFLGILIYIILGIILNVVFFMYAFINYSSGLIFGFKRGFIISYAIVIISAIIGFFISRNILKNKVEKKIKKYELLNNIHKNQDSYNTIEWIIYNIISRVSPLPFTINNYFWGSTKITFINYIIGTMIGVLPWLLFEVYIGSKIKNIHKIFD